MYRALGFAAGLSILLATPIGCDKSEPATANPDAAAAPTASEAEPDPIAEGEADAEAVEAAQDDTGDEGGETSEGGEGDEGAEVASNDGDSGAAPDASEGEGLDRSMEHVQSAIAMLATSVHQTYVGDVV